MFPIKYIENNLVFNHDGECFAYYELIPYNYSFLSPEEKYMVHDNFCLLYTSMDRRDKGKGIDKTNQYRSLRRTELKEIYIVRYADDFKIFCKKRSHAAVSYTHLDVYKRQGADSHNQGSAGNACVRRTKEARNTRYAEP